MTTSTASNLGMPSSTARAGKRARRRGAPQPFDFRRPAALSREHERVLQIAGETFARQYTTLLSTLLRTGAQASLASVDQFTYDEFVGMIENPCYLAIVSMEPLAGASALYLPLSLVMAWIDRLLGGVGGGIHPRRTLTDIETSLMRELVERTLKELVSALEPVVQVEPKVVAVEYNPQFAQIASPADLMLSLTFEIRIGNRSETSSFAVPYGSLQGPLDSHIAHAMFSDRSPTESEALTRSLSGRLLLAPVEVEVSFNTVAVSSGELLDLEVGDVLGLGHPVSEPLTVSVGGVPCLAAVAGRREKRLACQIVARPGVLQ